MELDIKKYLEDAKLAAHLAGEYLSDNFGKKHIAQFKSESDIGLAEDIESEKIILDILKGKFPKHNFYSEEIGNIDKNSDYTWYIDPLDGTNNYFAGIPYFSVSIALMIKNEIVLGLIYNPISNQLFEAIKGGGAFLNGVQIHPSETNDFKKSVCSFIQGHSVSSTKDLGNESNKLDEKLSTNFRRVIKTWAPALDWALLAFGGIDALISFESELEDMYAGLIIALESGVKVLNFHGDEFKIGDTRIIASNNLIQNELLNLISK